jgi:predicted ChrR family anti-sigma factor
VNMLDCEKATAILTEFEDGGLSWSMALRMRMHISRCRPCQTLISTSHALVGIMGRLFQSDVERFQSQGKQALVAIQGRLGEKFRRVPTPRTPVPSSVKPLLENISDDPLRLLSLAHSTIFSVIPRDADPLLPQELAEELPPRASWVWRKIRSMRVADLLSDKLHDTHLSLLFVPPGYRISRHSHPGSESLLLLDGELTDVSGTHVTGEWIHYDACIEHSPLIGKDGCWCLVREEGYRQFHGSMDRLKSWLDSH